MSKIDDGGPAFPTEPNTQSGFYSHHGMSLRDWFAGQFIAGNISSTRFFDELAAEAYGMADAMLAERAKRG